ncbi:hypothetical protein I6E50_08205 [Roseburia hominis]|nr:hypothetical protein [Roseburia hominis]
MRFAAPSTKSAVLGAIALVFSGIFLLIKNLSEQIPIAFLTQTVWFNVFTGWLAHISKMLFIVGITAIIIALILRITMSDTTRICLMVKKSLFCYEYGNPLHLKEDELLPSVRCKTAGNGIFELTITATTVTVENIQNLSSSISSSLNGKRYKQYAVTQTNTDLAFNEVTFRIEDVTIDKSLIINNINEIKPESPTKLLIQKDTYIDLTTSGSILVSGKTRSGKTTSIIFIILSVLLAGRDKYDSRIIIIDPKQAELSRLPHVVTLDADGEATAILEAVRCFADSVVKRQQILNDLSEKKGDAVHWWDAGFHASILFIDEYVACRTIFPQKPSKENPEYCLATFDSLLKRIVTMGASAGNFVIISIAEASVMEGGLPSILRSAMTTKILFKPTITEGRFLWDSEKLKDFNTGRVYHAGDAWFSSTDGVHDNVSYVHFPIMNFAVYRELGKLLDAYYRTE